MFGIAAPVSLTTSATRRPLRPKCAHDVLPEAPTRPRRTRKVRAEGLEPTRSLEHRHLKPARLPFRHAREDSDLNVTPRSGIPRRANGRCVRRVDHGSEGFDRSRRRPGLRSTALNGQAGEHRVRLEHRMPGKRRPEIDHGPAAGGVGFMGRIEGGEGHTGIARPSLPAGAHR